VLLPPWRQAIGGIIVICTKAHKSSSEQPDIDGGIGVQPPFVSAPCRKKSDVAISAQRKMGSMAIGWWKKTKGRKSSAEHESETLVVDDRQWEPKVMGRAHH